MWRCGVVLSLSPPCFLTCNSGSCTPENSSYSMAPLTWPQLSTGSDNNVSSFAPSGIKAEKSSCCYCPLSAPTFLNLVCVLIAKLCPTLCDPMDCKPPSSSVHRILQARILEWVTVPFSRGSSQPRDWIWVSCVTGRFFTNRATKEALKVKRVYKFSISQHVQLRLTKDSDPWLPYSKIIKMSTMSWVEMLLATMIGKMHIENQTFLFLRDAHYFCSFITDQNKARGHWKRGEKSACTLCLKEEKEKCYW